MKKHLIGLFAIISTLTSCNNRVVADFEIKNNTESRIDSLKIQPMVVSDGSYISLSPNENKEYKADMTGIPKTDGSYRISYKQNGERKIKDFGYYTNGYPSEKLTRIEIEQDTLKFDFEFGNY
jgi:hypothetical protein